MYINRGACIDRSFKLINYLMSPRTIKELAEHLEVDPVAAYRWLEAASLYMPVVEIGERQTAKQGRPAKLYQMQIKIIKNEVSYAN